MNVFKIAKCTHLCSCFRVLYTDEDGFILLRPVGTTFSFLVTLLYLGSVRQCSTAVVRAMPLYLQFLKGNVPAVPWSKLWVYGRPVTVLEWFSLPSVFQYLLGTFSVSVKLFI